jgi:hypothetical protein
VAHGTPKIDIRVPILIGIHILSVCPLLVACIPPSKVKVMSVASVPQGDSLKRRLASWFLPPIVIPIMLAALIVGSLLYRA